MTPDQLNAYVALLSSAMAIGGKIAEGVKGLMRKELTPEENRAVLAVWEDNVRRSGENAGLPPAK